ncbi:hypothetical protein SteCoe_27306 [Stentor coeruleus]|uniref:TRP C-terminal domain-containing protein n=1 Tax=Stentor coeruleus TaxID=5963 RepID=A0A1R2BAY4_9CILI|nr:hypothetical protein SteCoe_27306 [Stentor coeruleus]
MVMANNSVVISFTEDLGVSLKEENIKVYIENAKFSNGFVKLSNNMFLVPIQFFSDIYADTEITISFINIELIGSKNEQYSKVELKAKLNKMEYYVSYEITKKAVNYTQTGVIVSISASIVSAIFSNPSLAWILLSKIQLITYIPLNSNPLTSVLKLFFCGFSIENLIPSSFSNYIKIPHFSDAYLEARRYGIKTSSFIYNAEFLILDFLIILGSFPFIYIMTKIKIREITEKFIGLLKNYRYNVFLRYWIQSYLDLGMFATITFRTLVDKKISDYNWLDYLNGGISIIVIVIYKQILAILTPFVLFIGSALSYKKLHSQNNQEYLSRWGSLFLEFKNNKGFWSTQYYLIFFIRRLALIISQIYLNSYLKVQGALNIAFSLFQFIFLLAFKPYKEKLILISAFLAEGCVLITNILIYPILFDIENHKNVFKAIETTIVIMIFTESGIQTLFSLYKIAIGLKEIYNRIKNLISSKRYRIQNTDVVKVDTLEITSRNMIPFEQTIEITVNDNQK